MMLADPLNSASHLGSPCIMLALAMRWEGRAGGEDTAELNDGVSKAEVGHRGSRASGCLAWIEVSDGFLLVGWLGGLVWFGLFCLRPESELVIL